MYRAAFNFARHVVKDTGLAMGVVAFAEAVDLTSRYAGNRISIFAKQITKPSIGLNNSESKEETIKQPPQLA